MITAEQKATVEKQIGECLSMGAEIAARSPVPENGERYTPAVVLTGVTPGMPVMTDEIFGPVVCVCPVEDDEEAVRIANASSYSLTASVWSRNRRQARRIAVQINAGAVMINDHLMSHGLAETPWGGFGDSGLGRTHGENGFAEMVKTTVIVDDVLPGVKRDIFWHPYSEKTYRGIRDIARFAAPSPFFDKIRSLPGLVKIFFRYWDSADS
jgi:succinate-semialdehyde dehydrogenase/glutarate-semialdehyde dehydrogenase